MNDQPTLVAGVQRMRIHVELDRRINFAMQQNDVPVVKTLHLENLTDEVVRDLELSITTEPDFGSPWNGRISAIPGQSRYNVDAVDLDLSPAMLSRLTERVKGCLRFRVSRGTEELASRVESVELLAFDEWSGSASLPEILAAFVTPNHPAVATTLRRVSELLGTWTEESSLDGYQSKSVKRAQLMAAAVYTSIRDAGLTYVNPPPSFESDGQRIRLPGRLLEQGMGTCLDLAVLAAAALEACGLHPLVVLIEGHAFTGVWLQEESFGEAACDDCVRLRKRVELSEISVFDPTLALSARRPDYEVAAEEAWRHLQRPERFAYFVDVRRARIGRIRPLPERIESSARDSTNSQERVFEPTIDATHPVAPTLADVPVPPMAIGETSTLETPKSRLERWCTRLLDLSLRNRLLNFKDSKKAVRLLCPDLHVLEDSLADGRVFAILPKPTELTEADPRDEAVHLRRTGEDGYQEFLRAEFQHGRLHTNVTDLETSRRLTEIYRAARRAQEEGDASELFLALGMLAWYETDKSETRRYAPILMLPVSLLRKSVHEGFKLEAGDEDPALNVTLLEMLKKEHGIQIAGVDPLPGDESGVDVTAVFRRFREAVRDVDRWEVVEQAWIGLFSFNKFLMWRDLTARTDELLKNRVVDHLVNRPKETFPSSGEFPRAERLDQDRRATGVFCPLSSDSSQLAAVMAAADGRSFVLEGPPGTGKSQTITNLIAHCLAEGKRVLFVSEKMAALSVVQRRLSQLGLDCFCLELHSNKANKREVIRQLADSLNGAVEHSTDEWEREAKRLEGLRNELNSYVHALHDRRTSGESVFKVTSRLIGLRDIPRVGLAWSSPDVFDPERLADLRELVARMTTAVEACREIVDHPWRAVRFSDWKPGWQEHALEQVATLTQKAAALRKAATVLSSPLSVGVAELGFDALEVIDELAEALSRCPRPPRAVLVEPNWDQVQELLDSWIQHGRVRNSRRQEVFEHYEEEACDLNTADLLAQLRRANSSSWPLSWWRRRPVVAELRRVSLSGKAPARTRLERDVKRIAELQEKEEQLEQAGDKAPQLLGHHWRDGEADWDGLASIRDWARRFRSLAQRFAEEDLDRAASVRTAWARLATEGADLLQPDQSVGRALSSFRVAFKELKAACDACAQTLDLDASIAWGGVEEAGALARIEQTARHWQSQSSWLKEWCAWRRVRAEGVGAGLAPLIEGLENATFAPGDLSDVFERSYGQWWLNAVVDTEPVLAGFTSAEHERKIREFRSVDQRYTDLTRRIIHARLAAKVPAVNSSVKTSEIGILQREVAKKRRHMPVRKLFAQIPKVLPRLKPCLLMSPISIAQFLDPSYPRFDLVVFDEASQIPVWDAVGAIARGEQVVVVGDPKQLPPTNFFQRGSDEEEFEGDVVEDLESILDDCIGASIPCLSLDWHYRSRHESLIAFSNHHYYGNRLLTFPAADREGIGVSWRQVANGVYDKGHSRTNRAEAEAVVEEIIGRLRDPERRHLTIGVVTFSQTQQTLVEDLIDAARKNDQELDRLCSDESDEPVFVKNLENVQGDERDVILFSICYGPDAQGRVAMNFGPLNRDGGERRLNVAITRARREVIVFSTLRADQIDLNRTKARGVQDLKTFLDYAHRGPTAIAEATHWKGLEDFDSPFEKEVHQALSRRGYEVHVQVGCSGYRIDLAVIDRERPGRYLIGIECDGAHYHSAKTARDRDRLREEVLRSVGWEIHRIWSTDWWMDPARELEKIEAAIEAAREARARKEATATVDAAKAAEPVAVAARIATAPVAATPRSARFDGATTVHAVVTSPVQVGKPAEEFPPYRLADNLSVVGGDFYAPESVHIIRRLLERVVDAEAPILLEVAAKRIGDAWGFGRVRKKAIARIETLATSTPVKWDRATGETVLWRESDNPEEWFEIRGPSRHEADLRTIPEIPLVELANAVRHVLEQHVSLPAEDLAREAARLFGCARLGSKVRDRMDRAIRLVVRRGKAERDSGAVTVVE